jgi:hypothetical protein
VLAVWLTTACPAQLTPPPQGRDITIEVPRGGQAAITLTGFDRNRRPLVIGIDPQRGPRWGTLGPVRPAGENRATVTYRHGDDGSSTDDEFYYTIRLASGGMAGRAKVSIRILESAPVLLIPATLDFGPVVVGDPAPSLDLQMANLGGGRIEGVLQLPAPFFVGGNGSFRLGRNESSRLPVTFDPVRPGLYSFPVQPAAPDPATVVVRGEALAPIEIVADETILRPDAEGTRRLDFGIINRSILPQTIGVEIPAGLPVEIEAIGELAPGASVPVTLRLSPGHKTAVPPFPLRVTAGEYAETIEVSAPALPAELTIVTPPDFGAITTGKTSKAELVLRNTGGQTAEARLLLEPPLRQPRGDVPAFAIEPDETLTLALEVRPTRDQIVPSTLGLEIRGEIFDVPVLLGVTTEPPAPEPTPTPTPPPPLPWQLNRDIELADGPAIEWIEREGWRDFQLQQHDGPTGQWVDYTEPPASTGLIDWLRGWGDKIQHFLETPIDRGPITDRDTTTAPAVAELHRQNLGPIDEQVLWRLVATAPGETAPRAITPAFRISGEQLVVATEAAPEPPTPTPIASVTPRTLLRDQPLTAIESAGIKSDRHEALVQIATAENPAITGFRVERGAMVSAIDPQTGIPAAPVFEIIDPPGTTIELLGTYAAEHEERKLSVFLARVSGLDAGTRTYWRLVPETAGGELPPTPVFLIDTQPRPPFPWNTLVLIILGLLLAGVLYLRWRINRPPA